MTGKNASTTGQRAYIGIGSNIGDGSAHCMRAAALLGTIPGCTLEASSDLFTTEPVGVEGQDWYVNAVACLLADMPPHDLLERLLAIEQDMGRVRKERWGPRTMDLDILLFGREVLRTGDLEIPHPRMHERRFVLEPMVQLAPDLVHPVLGKTMTRLLEECPSRGQAVVRMEPHG